MNESVIFIATHKNMKLKLKKKLKQICERNPITITKYKQYSSVNKVEKII